MSQNPFPFPTVLKVERSVEFFSGNFCFQDGYLSMEQLCLVDCSTCSWDFYRYLEWWGLDAHPHPWAKMWAWTSDWSMSWVCTGKPTLGKRELLCLPVCTVKEARLQSTRDSQFRQTYNSKLKKCFGFFFCFSSLASILMDAVFEHFCLPLSFYLFLIYCYYLECLWFWKLLSITYFSCISKHIINRKSLIHCYSHVKVWVESNSTTGT